MYESGGVLIVDGDERRRSAVRSSCTARSIPILEVPDAFAAMAALGRSNFAAIVVAEGKRHLSLRGLCQLARKRHPNIRLFVMLRSDTDLDVLQGAIGVSVDPLAAEMSSEQIAARIAEGLGQSDEPLPELDLDLGAAPPEVPDPFEVESLPPPTIELDAQLPSPEELTPPVAPASISLPPPDPLPEPLPEPTPIELEGGFAPRPITGLVAISPQPPPEPPPPLEEPPPTVEEPFTGDEPVPVEVAVEVEEAAPLAVEAEEVDLVPVEPVPVEPDHLELVPVEPPAPAPVAVAPAAPEVVLEGSLDEGSGAALLMGLYAQELTGRLVVEGGTTTTVFIYEGEPVWAEVSGGDAAIYQRLVQKRLLAPDAPVAAVPEGQLLHSLARSGQLSQSVVQDFMRGVVRDGILELASKSGGSYRFVEDPAFRQATPLFRLNPFGLILESKRRGMTPDRLLAIAHEMQDHYLIPGPGLAHASRKIAPFARELDLSTLITGDTTVGEFSGATGLDVMMGTLVILALDDARLVRLAERPLSEAGAVPARIDL